MTSSKARRENAWKSRKQNQKPHGEVKSLAELDQEGGNNSTGYSKPEQW